MNMTEQDWENMLAEYNGSLFELFQDQYQTDPGPDSKKPDFRRDMSPAEFDEQYWQRPKPELKGYYTPTGDQSFPYIRIGKTTPKARFYVTHETLGEIHGFWCPKVAIIKDWEKELTVARWCEIKIIQFV